MPESYRILISRIERTPGRFDPAPAYLVEGEFHTLAGAVAEADHHYEAIIARQPLLATVAVVPADAKDNTVHWARHWPPPLPVAIDTDAQRAA